MHCRHVLHHVVNSHSLQNLFILYFKKEKELIRYSFFSVDDNFKEKETKKNWPDGISLNEMHTHICIYSSVLDLDKRSNAHVFSLSSLILEQTSISRMRKNKKFFLVLMQTGNKTKIPLPADSTSRLYTHKESHRQSAINYSETGS